MLTFSKILVSGGVMTGTSVVTAPVQQMTNMIYFSVQCVWTGTPTGVFKLQATNDLAIVSTTAWTDLTTTSGPLLLNGSQPAGSASNLMFCNNATGCPWTFLQLVYTNGSGTGAFTATISGKGA